MFKTLQELIQLIEMSPPVLEPRELPTFIQQGRFKSNDTLSVDYNLVENISNFNDINSISIFIKKDKSSAIIGYISNREPDNKEGIFILGELEFKDIDIGNNIPTKLSKNNILQVGGVEITKSKKKEGFGYLLYFTLIMNGYTLISDNVQYLGGQALWKKVAAFAKFSKYKVYVMDNGIFRRNKQGYVYYDGFNIDDSKLWSNDYEKYHTLFVATLQ